MQLPSISTLPFIIYCLAAQLPSYSTVFPFNSNLHNQLSSRATSFTSTAFPLNPSFSYVHKSIPTLLSYYPNSFLSAAFFLYSDHPTLLPALFPFHLTKQPSFSSLIFPFNPTLPRYSLPPHVQPSLSTTFPLLLSLSTAFHHYSLPQ